MSDKRRKLRIDIEPDRRDSVLRHGPWDIGIFSNYKAAIAEAIRMAQRQVCQRLSIDSARITISS